MFCSKVYYSFSLFFYFDDFSDFHDVIIKDIHIFIFIVRYAMIGIYMLIVILILTIIVIILTIMIKILGFFYRCVDVYLQESLQRKNYGPPNKGVTTV